MKRISVIIIIALIAAMAVSALPGLGNELTENDSDAVYIVKGSTINLVARESSIPVVVTNGLAGEVRVIVNLRSNSPKLMLIENQVSLVLPAGETATAQFPVRAIGSGQVAMVAQLSSLSGKNIGNPVGIKMVVNPDIENTAIVLFLSLVAALIVIGVIRTLRRKRSG